MMDIFNNKQASPFENVMTRIEEMTKQASGNAVKVISFQEYAIIVTEEDSVLHFSDRAALEKFAEEG